MAATIFENWYNRVTKWYLSKPWYIRLLCFGLLIVISILFLLRIFYKGNTTKDSIAPVDIVPPPINPTKPNDDEEITSAENTLALKTKMIGQLKERDQAAEVFEKQATEIINAEKMGDLHELRKKFNL